MGTTRHSATMRPTPAYKFDYARLLIGLILVALAFRWFIMATSPLGLHGDEAQYWAWSQDPDWGYFSKPPLIAWIIAASTSLFGQAEWAIRLPSALLHSLTTYVMFLTGRQAFNAQVGFWAACAYLAMPAVWLSSTIISTDVPLLLCWALALNAWVALRLRPSWPRSIQLGLAVGFGLLAKYAMMFFLPVLGAAIIFDTSTRKALLNLKGLVAVLIVVALFVPNIIWNLNHDFATLNHTTDNANLSGPLINPEELLSFWTDQFAVFGLLSFPLLIAAFVYSKSLPALGRWFGAFAALPLLLISTQALLSRANANWAVTAYIAAPFIVTLFALSRPKLFPLFKWGLIGQSVIMVIMGLSLLIPAFTDALGLSNSVKRLRAWPETTTQIAALYKAGHQGDVFRAVATDNRLVFYDLTYYGLTDTAPLYMWRLSVSPGNHAEMTDPLPEGNGPVLLINHYEDYEPFFRKDFERLVELEPMAIELGGGKTRHLRVWAGYGYTATTKARAL